MITSYPEVVRFKKCTLSLTDTRDAKPQRSMLNMDSS